MGCFPSKDKRIEKMVAQLVAEALESGDRVDRVEISEGPPKVKAKSNLIAVLNIKPEHDFEVFSEEDLEKLCPSKTFGGVRKLDGRVWRITFKKEADGWKAWNFVSELERDDVSSSLMTMAPDKKENEA
jgi:hypothetical protein